MLLAIVDRTQTLDKSHDVMLASRDCILYIWNLFLCLKSFLCFITFVSFMRCTWIHLSFVWGNVEMLATADQKTDIPVCKFIVLSLTMPPIFFYLLWSLFMQLKGNLYHSIIASLIHELLVAIVMDLHSNIKPNHTMIVNFHTM